MHISAYPGVPQYVVTMPGPENCGSAGCMSGVIVKRAGAWQVVFSGFNIWALPSLTNGFHDLIIGYKGPGFEFQGPFQRFQWDGDRYVQNQWVNISNGSAPGFSVN